MSIAVITGASSGIGAEFVRALFSEKGAFPKETFEEVWILARRNAQLEAIKDELSAFPIRVISLDLLNQDDLSSFSFLLEKESPDIKLLIQCAGIGKTGSFLLMSPQNIQEQIMVNCTALSVMAHICLPYMIPLGKKTARKNGPMILHIASSAGFLPQPNFSIYAASKAYVISFSRALRKELQEYNISVTTLCPGPVDTEFQEKASGQMGVSPKGFKTYFLVSAQKVAKKGLRAAKKRKSLVVYGLSQKALHVLSKILPHRVFIFFSSKIN